MISPRAWLPALLLLPGCGTVPNAKQTDVAGDFSVVVGVPPEWAARVDEARYLEEADCALLCPAAFAGRVSSCHLARVVSKQASADTAAVVCNGGSQAGR